VNHQHRNRETKTIEAQSAELSAVGLKSIYHQGEILAVSLTLAVNGVCLFDPVLRFFIRATGTERHLVASDLHQGGFFYPWLPRGNYQFGYRWPVSLPAGDFDLCISWGSADVVRQPDLIIPIRITGPIRVIGSNVWYLVSVRCHA